MDNNISIKLGGVTLNSPLIIGANDSILDFETFELIAQTTSKLGAVVTKSFTKEPRLGNKDPIVATLNNNVLVSSGLRNPGAKIMFCDIEKYNNKYSAPALIPSIASDPASMNPNPEKELASLALGLYERGSKVIELNLSCPNLGTNGIVADRLEKVRLIISHLKNEFEKRNYKNYFLIAKLAGNDSSLFKVAKEAETAGIDAITILPLLRAVAFYTGLIETEKSSYKSGEYLLGNKDGTVYGEGLGPLTRYLVMELRKHIHIPIIASGGCLGGYYSSIFEKADGLIQTIMAGAHAVTVVSPFYPFNQEKLLEIDLVLDEYHNYYSTLKL